MPLPRSAAFLKLSDEPDLSVEPVAQTLSRPRPKEETAPPEAEFEAALKRGLKCEDGKVIPSSWLYDEVGSGLFEVITHLPEYGLTRADERQIARCAPRLPALLHATPFVAELGSGSGRKTRAILEALSSSRKGTLPYAPVDVSRSALEACARDLESIDGVEVHPTMGSYLEGLALALQRRPWGRPALVLFLGSTIGNFMRSEVSDFLTGIRKLLQPGDWLLLGADLDKQADVLELAYDDPAGVTAAFNRNLLGHLNRAFDGDFDLQQFAHRAVYNRADRRIEMYLEALTAQQVCLAALDLRVNLAEGERILTEYSHKFHLEELRQFATNSGFTPTEEWVDREWPFAENLWRAV
jgi:L-histidine Nalpha-methyltransferase